MIRVLVVASRELSLHDRGEQLGIGTYQCELLLGGGRSRDPGIFLHGPRFRVGERSATCESEEAGDPRKGGEGRTSRD